MAAQQQSPLLALPRDTLLLILRRLPFWPLVHLVPRICSKLRAIAPYAVCYLPEDFPPRHVARALAQWPCLTSVSINLRFPQSLLALQDHGRALEELDISALSSDHSKDCLQGSMACLSLMKINGLRSLAIDGFLCRSLAPLISNNAATLTSLTCSATATDDAVEAILALPRLQWLVLEASPATTRLTALAPLLTHLTLGGVTTAGMQFPRLRTLTLTATARDVYALHVVKSAPQLSGIAIHDRFACFEVQDTWPHLITELRSTTAVARIAAHTRLQVLRDSYNTVSHSLVKGTARYQSIFGNPQLASLTQLRALDLSMRLDFDFATEKQFVLNACNLPHLTHITVRLATPDRFAELLQFFLHRFPSLQEVRLDVTSSSANTGGLEEECAEAGRILTAAKSPPLRCVRLNFMHSSAVIVRAPLAALSRQLLWLNLRCTVNT